MNSPAHGCPDDNHPAGDGVQAPTGAGVSHDAGSTYAGLVPLPGLADPLVQWKKLVPNINGSLGEFLSNDAI